MMKAKDLVELFWQARNERWGYIWGKRGQVWTQANQDAATREQTVKWGSRWVGKRVADCSGLFVWAFKELGGSIYHGSNTMWKKYCSEQGDIIAGTEIKLGAAVFKVNQSGSRHHVGLHVGGGVVIEAKGTYYGVVQSKIEEWDEWGDLKDVDYTDAGEAYTAQVPRRTLRRGDRGSQVKEAQEKLQNIGYDVGKAGADGIFGSGTEKGVRALQEANGLQVDGIVGADTWAKLDELDGGIGGPGVPVVRYTVTVRGLNAAEAEGVLETWGERATREVEQSEDTEVMT